MAESNTQTAAGIAPASTTYSNIEILNLVTMALLYGCKEGESDRVIVRSWVALDDAFERGRKHGYEEGYRAGLIAANQAETAAVLVIEGLCRKEVHHD